MGKTESLMGSVMLKGVCTWLKNWQISICLQTRSFSYCAPKIWNDILLSVRQSPSLNSFKHNLKTHYFANNWLPGEATASSASEFLT